MQTAEGNVVFVVHQHGDCRVDRKLRVPHVSTIGLVRELAIRLDARRTNNPADGSADLLNAVAGPQSPPHGMKRLTHGHCVRRTIGHLRKATRILHLEYTILINITPPSMTQARPPASNAKVISPVGVENPLAVAWADVGRHDLAAERVDMIARVP